MKTEKGHMIKRRRHKYKKRKEEYELNKTIKKNMKDADWNSR